MHLTMSFWHRDHQVCWHNIVGPSKPSLHSCSGRNLLNVLSMTSATSSPSRRAYRCHDHHITLLPGVAPVAVRAYRYPPMHKDELERQCRTMLELLRLLLVGPPHQESRQLMAILRRLPGLELHDHQGRLPHTGRR